MKYFCINKEKIAYMECVIQSSMFYSFNLSLSILLCNVGSALISDFIFEFRIVFYWEFRVLLKRGAERDVMQEDSREQT